MVARPHLPKSPLANLHQLETKPGIFDHGNTRTNPNWGANSAHQCTANHNGSVLAWSLIVVGIRDLPNLTALHGGVN